MIAYEEMPENNADLAAIDFDFPRLNPDTTADCPVSLGDIVEYLKLESPDADSVLVSQLTFLRTAFVEEHSYWIWEFIETDGTKCYATVSLDAAGSLYIGYGEDSYCLSPQQFILGDYHDVF